ncbi:hypothetical protein M5689_014747 [Euphorbia peplus]|nr:hypothetical protein M5689_014747 [Euphorbia peplus]
MANLVGIVPEIRKNNSPKLKTMKKPMKVVYIANPIKFKISASQFRALVQEFTGKYSELADPSRFFGDDSRVGCEDQTVLNNAAKINDVDEAVPPVDLSGTKEETSDDTLVESAAAFDDIFTPLMIDNLSGLMDSSLFNEE